MKPLPDPRETAGRTSVALRELAASETLASNLAAGLRADARLLDDLFPNASSPDSPSALGAAIKATEHALGAAQAIQGWAALSRRWTSLLAPAARSPDAVTMVGALATLDLVEDFLAHTSHLFAIAAEASAECEDVAKALRQTLKKPR